VKGGDRRLLEHGNFETPCSAWPAKFHFAYALLAGGGAVRAISKRNRSKCINSNEFMIKKVYLQFYTPIDTPNFVSGRRKFLPVDLGVRFWAYGEKISPCRVSNGSGTSES
jgi:hypothetical protein